VQPDDLQWVGAELTRVQPLRVPCSVVDFLAFETLQLEIAIDGHEIQAEDEASL
jgi:hypothetical protein